MLSASVRMAYGLAARSENSVLLGKWYGLVDASVDAYLCDECQKVIIDVPKPKEKNKK